MPKVAYSVSMVAEEGKADEVRESLMVNVREEGGNVVYALHRPTHDPDELSYYETWETVGARESSARFEVDKSRLRPLVDGDTVHFGNATPIAVLG